MCLPWESGEALRTLRKRLPQTNRAELLPRMARAAAQVTPAERRLEYQTESGMTGDKQNTWEEERKEYERGRFAQKGT